MTGGAVGEDAGGVSAVIAFNDDRWIVDADHPLTFGRSDRPGVVGVDPDDVGISRVAGRLRAGPSAVVVENLSFKRPLLVEYPMLVRHRRVEPETSHVLVSDATVLVAGKAFTHAFRVSIPPEFHLRSGAVALDTVQPPTETEGLITPAEREALIAMAAGYLERWPRHDPNPRTYEAAGGMLGLSEPTVRKRIEHLRERLDVRGVLVTSGADAKRTLIDWAIDAGEVRVSDLDHLKKRPTSRTATTD